MYNTYVFMPLNPNPIAIDDQFLIPNIKLVGFSKIDTYQISCLKCKRLFFEKIPYGRAFDRRWITDLFCESCDKSSNLCQYLFEENVDRHNRVGNIVGFEVKVPHHIKYRSRFNYKKIYQRDHYQCQYCGYSPYLDENFIALHIDHLIPWCFGGSNKMGNLCVACQECNGIANNKFFRYFEDKKSYILNKKADKGLKVFRVTQCPI